MTELRPAMAEAWRLQGLSVKNTFIEYGMEDDISLPARRSQSQPPKPRAPWEARAGDHAATCDDLGIFDSDFYSQGKMPMPFEEGKIKGDAIMDDELVCNQQWEPEISGPSVSASEPEREMECHPAAPATSVEAAVGRQGRHSNNSLATPPSPPLPEKDETSAAAERRAPVVMPALQLACNQYWRGHATADQASTAIRLAMTALEVANGSASTTAWDNVYTVMMRNLPNKVTQDLLLEELDEAGFGNTYDFVHLPIDPDTTTNKGYAFINFVTPGFAHMFKQHFEGWRFQNFNSHKVVSVVPAVVQGYDANYAHYCRARPRHPALDQAIFLRAPKSKRPQRKANVGNSSQSGRQKHMSLIDIAAKKQKECQLKMQSQHQASAGSAERQIMGMLPQGAQHNSSNGAAGKAAQNSMAPRWPKFCPYCGGFSNARYSPMPTKLCELCGEQLPMLSG
jgi:hypothetical protein